MPKPAKRRRSQGDLRHRAEARKGAERSRRLDLCADRGWSKEEIAWVDDYLSFNGRIGRDDWIDQAAKLAAAAAKAQGLRGRMHLAELNIARLKYPFDDPRVAEFADNLDRVNGIAERSEVSSGGCRTTAAMPPTFAASTIRW